MLNDTPDNVTDLILFYVSHFLVPGHYYFLYLKSYPFNASLIVQNLNIASYCIA